MWGPTSPVVLTAFVPTSSTTAGTVATFSATPALATSWLCPPTLSQCVCVTAAIPCYCSAALPQPPEAISPTSRDLSLLTSILKSGGSLRYSAKLGISRDLQGPKRIKGKNEAFTRPSASEESAQWRLSTFHGLCGASSCRYTSCPRLCPGFGTGANSQFCYATFILQRIDLFCSSLLVQNPLSYPRPTETLISAVL